jgi:hypothetical protein
MTFMAWSWLVTYALLTNAHVNGHEVKAISTKRSNTAMNGLTMLVLEFLVRQKGVS